MPSNAPWMLCLLDQFRLERDGSEVLRFYDRRQDQVLAYLAMHRHRPMSRLDMAKALWPDRDPGLARGRLSECLHYIKRELADAGAPPQWITGNRHVVELDTELDTDVRDFENAVAGAIAGVSPERQIELLEQALSLYGEGLLPGMSGEWVAGERNRMLAIYETAARQLARSLQLAGAFEATPEFAQHMTPEDLARQWVKSRSLQTAPASPSPMPGVGEPWIPGKSLDALERRLAERAVATAEQAEPHLWGPERADWLAILDAEYGGIIVALRWAIEAKERDIALAISSALWPYWQARGKVAEGRELAESALALQTSGRLVVDARALHGAGVLALLEGDRVTAESRLGRARDLWIELDEPAWLGRCLNSLCVIAYRDGDLRTARDHARQATGILRKYGGRGALVRVLKDAALIEIADDDLDRAEELLTEAREIARDERNVAAEARILGNLSTVAQNRERWDHARELSEKAITMLAAEDDLEGVAFGLRGLGYICTSLGDLESAGTYFDDAIQLSTVLGNRWAVGETLRYKARLAIRAGHPAQAATLLASSMALFEETGDAAGSADVQSELAAIGPTNQD